VRLRFYPKLYRPDLAVAHFPTVGYSKIAVVVDPKMTVGATTEAEGKGYIVSDGVLLPLVRGALVLLGALLFCFFNRVP
jgi:hypothetical protein